MSEIIKIPVLPAVRPTTQNENITLIHGATRDFSGSTQSVVEAALGHYNPDKHRALQVVHNRSVAFNNGNNQAGVHLSESFNIGISKRPKYVRNVLLFLGGALGVATLFSLAAERYSDSELAHAIFDRRTGIEGHFDENKNPSTPVAPLGDETNRCSYKNESDQTIHTGENGPFTLSMQGDLAAHYNEEVLAGGIKSGFSIKLPCDYVEMVDANVPALKLQPELGQEPSSP